MPPLAPLRRVLWFSLCALPAVVLGAEAPPLPPLPELFAYDAKAPLQVRKLGVETRGAATVRDLTFVGVDRPVKAYLVAPRAAGPEPFAAILYVHWLGEPATTNRTEFLAEAVALAGRGTVSLLVDAMWAQPDWFGRRVPDQDRAACVHQVIELRRALDLLLSQPGIDAQRVALVGHDFGAMYGAVMGAVDRRPTTYVLMAATPHFTDWLRFGPPPKSLDAYRAENGPLDPVNAVARLAPAPVFFQFAAADFFVPASAAQELFAAAAPRKQMAVYAAKHDLGPVEVAADRVAWLARTLTLAP
jgi:predicted esterase